MEDQVRERDRVDEVRLLATPERVLAQRQQLLGGCARAETGAHVLERLGEDLALSDAVIYSIETWRRQSEQPPSL